jgi:hypothetical protein
MQIFISLLKAAWWVAAAYIPFAQIAFYRAYHSAIGCPPVGDCYFPGSEHLLGLEVLIAGCALVLWPACLWALIVKPLLSYATSRRAEVLAS